ncbi:SDR family NAD(P)-dependent oxidoreductase [uncultured Massilia sp.]|uniref:SDR family NAD(P)-dependent oxidoreductase n=1 Tax=uncultured Massilia sp. TaxID=169973 RepID=UPI0025F3B3F1|nr:SDR family NAD(P)-dependent oxidoreductase [uncultured Massilia sp.]
MKHFEGRIAVITGAADGLGRELANVAASLGMKLVLGDIDGDALERATADLQAGGAEVLSMVCDVRKCAHVEELADAAMIRFGAVHLVFNNAGVVAGGLVWEHTEADWEWVLGVNLWGAIHGVRLFTPLMLACAARDPAYEGHIVNTASTAGLAVAPAMGAYNVAERGLVALSETLYHDLRLAGAPIGASVLLPERMRTDFARSWRHRPQDLDNDGPPTRSQKAARTLLERELAQAGLRPTEMAQLAFDAIRAGRFHVHGTAPAPAGADGDAAPPDPYAALPGFRGMW